MRYGAERVPVLKLFLPCPIKIHCGCWVQLWMETLVKEADFSVLVDCIQGLARAAEHGCSFVGEIRLPRVRT